MARDFNPSNKPGTCIYCGAGLRHSVFKAHTFKNTISLCCQARVDQRMKRQPGIAGWAQERFCTVCGRSMVGDAEDTEVRVTEVPERRSAEAGYAGLFCTRDCGYRFGLLAARKGIRYTRRED
jgi:uncharacterized protein CbrC (UPF0167 family)